MQQNEDGTWGPLHITDTGRELRPQEGTMLTLEEALQKLHERLGHDPDCVARGDCDDCNLDVEVEEQLAELRA